MTFAVPRENAFEDLMPLAASRPPAMRNRLLSALPADDLARLLPHLERVVLRREVVYAEGSRIRRVYFPITGLFSVVAELDGGRPLEVTSIGPAGMAGLPVFLGEDVARRRVVSQIAGESLTMRSAVFQDEVTRNAALRDLMGRYTLARLSLLAQAVACNAGHRVGPRLARSLLQCQDAAGTADIPLTQDVLAQMLGVQRPSVSLAAERLQRQGLIGYRRGRVRIIDRPKLEAAACECYRAATTEHDRVVNGLRD